MNGLFIVFVGMFVITAVSWNFNSFHDALNGVKLQQIEKLKKKNHGPITSDWHFLSSW